MTVAAAGAPNPFRGTGCAPRTGRAAVASSRRNPSGGHRHPNSRMLRRFWQAGVCGDPVSLAAATSDPQART